MALLNSLPWVRRENEIRTREDELDRRERQQTQRQAELEKKQMVLTALAAKLERRKASLDLRNEQLAARDEKLKRQKEALEATGPWQQRSYFAEAAQRAIVGIPDARCFVLQNILRTVVSVPGDVSECGVRYGKSSYFLLKADAVGRTFHLFDSFEGLSEPTASDALPDQGEAFWKSNELAVTEEEVRGNLQDFDNVNYYRGWIPTRFNEVADRSFALVHVDVDLYEPTLASLEFFWPRLGKNGMLVCDDYGSPRCPGAKQALDEFFGERHVPILELPTMQAIAIKATH